MSEEKKALDMIRAVYDDGEATINGRTYKLTKATHKKRRKVFAFFTKHGSEIQAGNFSFLDTEEFASVESVINDLVMFDGNLLSRISEHWEDYPEDYMLFVPTMLGAISYPFLRGVAGG